MSENTPCDSCPNRAEHFLCDKCCHEEPDAILRENLKLWAENADLKAAKTKAHATHVARIKALTAGLRAEHAKVARLRAAVVALLVSLETWCQDPDAQALQDQAFARKALRETEVKP